MSYYTKYIKYKTKYLELKGGGVINAHIRTLKMTL